MSKSLIVSLILTAIIAATAAYAAHQYLEKDYQNKWCKEQKGRTEVVMEDRTRCDCLTSTYSVEFDFANKWAEAVGQSLNYSFKTGKKAGIVLILEDEKDKKYLDRLNGMIKEKKLPIKVWSVDKSYLAGGAKEEKPGVCFIGTAEN
jgi:hypothetical protein